MEIPIPAKCEIPNVGKRYCWIKEDTARFLTLIVPEAIPEEIFNRLPGEEQDPHKPEWHPPFHPYKMYESVTEALRALKKAQRA